MTTEPWGNIVEDVDSSSGQSGLIDDPQGSAPREPEELLVVNIFEPRTVFSPLPDIFHWPGFPA